MTLTTPPQGPTSAINAQVQTGLDQEALARIVDPTVWSLQDEDPSLLADTKITRHAERALQASLDAAAAIIAHVSPLLEERDAEIARLRKALAVTTDETRELVAEIATRDARIKALEEVCQTLVDSYSVDVGTGAYALGMLHGAREKARALLNPSTVEGKEDV